MNYALDYCILTISLILIVNLEHITVVTKANLIIYGKLFSHIIPDIVTLLHLLADINRIFIAWGSAPFKAGCSL